MLQGVTSQYPISYFFSLLSVRASLRPLYIMTKTCRMTSYRRRHHGDASSASLSRDRRPSLNPKSRK